MISSQDFELGFRVGPRVKISSQDFHIRTSSQNLLRISSQDHDRVSHRFSPFPPWWSTIAPAQALGG